MEKAKRAVTKLPFGREFGCLYPLMYLLLQIEKWWPSEALLLQKHKDSRLITDIYIAVCWAIEAIAIIILVNINYNLCTVRIIIVAILVYRLIEIFLKLIATFILGKYRLPVEHHSQNRTVFLVLMNLLEIIFIYSAFYYFLDKYILEANVSIGIKGFLDALYFSMATGITMSFGQQFPKNVYSKFIVISEPLIILVIVIGMISFARGSSADKNGINKKINKE